MPLNCGTPYFIKFGKLISGHRTGKGHFSFQWRAMVKNVQTTLYLPSFYMLASLCSKSFMLDFSSTCTKNFQMYKLGFKEAEEPDIQLPTFIGSWRKQRNSKKNIHLCFTDYTKTLTVWITTNHGQFLMSLEYETTFLVSWNTCNAHQEGRVWTRHGTAG